MFSATELTKIYDTVLSIPGMSDTVKIDLRIARKSVLLLSKVIERGLAVKDKDNAGSMLSNVDDGIAEELTNIANELLQKAGLQEMNQKLNALV